MGGPRFEREVRDLARSIAAPNVVIAHGPVSVPASSQLSSLFPLFDGDGPVRFASTVDEARNEIEQAVVERADLLKTGYLGGGVTPPRETELFWREVLPALVASSARRGLPIVAHLESLEAAKRFVSAGVTRLAHTFADAAADREFIDLAKERRTMIATTMLSLDRAVERAITGGFRLEPIETRCGDREVVQSWSKLPPVPAQATSLEGMRRALAMMRENVAALHAAGIPIAVGSDAAASPGLLHGASFHRELRLLADAGVPPAAIIVAATRTGARFIGKEADVGTIEPGKVADLLVLDSDPTVDVRNLASIRSVVKSGRVLDTGNLKP
jgi:imidazolonepropionase-like amidohydrolase